MTAGQVSLSATVEIEAPGSHSLIFDPEYLEYGAGETRVIGVDSASPLYGGYWTWYIDGVESAVHDPAYTAPSAEAGFYTISVTVLLDEVLYSGDISCAVLENAGTHRLWYDLNGVTAAGYDDSQLAPGAIVTLLVPPSAPAFTEFYRWATDDLGASTIRYQSGETFIMPDNPVCLKAEWRPVAFPVESLTETPFSMAIALSWTNPNSSYVESIHVSWSASSVVVGSTVLSPGTESIYIDGLLHDIVYTCEVRVYYGKDSEGNDIFSSPVSIGVTPNE